MRAEVRVVTAAAAEVHAQVEALAGRDGIGHGDDPRGVGGGRRGAVARVVLQRRGRVVLQGYQEKTSHVNHDLYLVYYLICID